MNADDAYMEAMRTTIKVELTERDWDRGDLADRSGLTYVTVGRILRGERDLTMPYLISIASAFGWTAGELLLKAERRLRDHGRDVPGAPGIHPEVAEIIDSSDKLTRRQREQTKTALTDEAPDITRMTDKPDRDDNLGSSERGPRRAGND